MYQRLAMFLSATSGADEDEGHDVADHQIRDREEDAGKPHHHEDHDGGDHDLLAGPKIPKSVTHTSFFLLSPCYLAVLVHIMIILQISYLIHNSRMKT